MKGITTILYSILLLLALKPCSDGNNAEDLIVDTTLEVNHNHQEDSDDSCPATCICSCCGIAITYQPLKHYTIKNTPEISTVVFYEYQSNYIFDFLSNIWQPPQMIS